MDNDLKGGLASDEGELCKQYSGELSVGETCLPGCGGDVVEVGRELHLREQLCARSREGV